MDRPLYKIYQATASGADVHHDTLLSNVAVAAFDAGVEGIIGDQIFPSVRVAKQSDRYVVISKDAFLRIPTDDLRRAPKTEALRVEFTVSSEAYFAENYAIAGELALEDLANADSPFNLRSNETALITGLLRLGQEERIANIVTSLTNLGSGTTLTGGDKWSDPINSSPLSDVTTGHAFIRSRTGLVANTGIIDWDTLQIVRRHPELLDLYKHVSGGQLDNGQIAAAFQVDKLLVGKGVKENALEGGTSSMTNLWGNNFILAHIEPAVSLRTRTFGLRFEWQPAGFPMAFSVGRRREVGAGTRNVEVIESQQFMDEKIVATDLAYGIGSTL